VLGLKPASSEETLTLVFIYSREYAEPVIRDLINDPSVRALTNMTKSTW